MLNGVVRMKSLAHPPRSSELVAPSETSPAQPSPPGTGFSFPRSAVSPAAGKKALFTLAYNSETSVDFIKKTITFKQSIKFVQ